jgi:hypothetical protein
MVARRIPQEHESGRVGQAKGKRLGRPKKSIDPAEATSLRADRNSWRTVSCKMGVSVGTVFAAAQES